MGIHGIKDMKSWVHSITKINRKKKFPCFHLLSNFFFYFFKFHSSGIFPSCCIQLINTILDPNYLDIIEGFEEFSDILKNHMKQGQFSKFDQLMEKFSPLVSQFNKMHNSG